MIKSLILLSCIAVVANAIYGFGACPNVATKEDLDLNAFSGRWYEVARVNNTIQTLSGCSFIDFNFTEGMTVTLKQSVVAIPMTQIGDMKSELTGDFTVNFRGDLNPFPMRLKVVDTDYTDYAVLYTCYDVFSMMNLQRAWIMSRKAPFTLPPIFNPTYNPTALKAYDRLNLNRQNLQPTIHVFCNYN